MTIKEHHHSHENVDESELWKRKSLASAANRRKFAKIMNLILCVLAVLVIAACIFAYFFD